MKNKKRKGKGFTLIELLVVIVIVGILSLIAVVATTKYIDKAKEEKDKQNETLIVETAKSYLESNPTKKPKSIGESLKIDLYTLRKNNYLKEDVKNSKNESCMTNSYVYVYKNDYDKYSYKGILYCGDEKVKPEKDIPRPTITDFVFADKEDVSKASFSMTIHGSDDDSVGIESYNYLIEVYKNKSKDQTEVYNSGSLSGRNQKTITVNNILISDYIKRTDYTEVKLIVLVRNTLGGVYELTKSAEFEDTLKPICGSVINEAKEDEWYNKKDVLKDNKKRKITVNCSDGNGSGCLRNTFSKTWPGNPVQSVEYSTIEIKDNKGIKNNCRVRVNIDVVAPTIKVTAYDGKNNVATTKTATDGKTKVIEKNSYKGNHDGWLNGTNYPGGVKYKVEVSDETRLNRYTWETSAGDSSSGYIVDKEDNPTKSSVFYIYLKDQGKRSGKLTVYDIAGNKTEMIINAYIDYTNPTCTNDVTCTGGGDCSRWLGISKSLTIKTICNDEGGSNCLPNTGGSFKYNDNIDIKNGGPGGAGKTVDVYDAAGNKGTCPANVTVRIDHINPTCTNVVTCTSGNKCNDWLGIGKFVKITAKCDDAGGSKCASSEEISHTYKDENINITNAGPAGLGKDVIVYDNAGNKGTCYANKTVKIDIEAPSAPKINLYKWSNNKTRPTSTSGLGSYTAGTWSNKKVYTKPSGSKDNYEFSHYEYKTEGKTTNQTNIQATYRNIEANGESKIYYRACDKAGNCSAYTSPYTVNIDYIAPELHMNVYKRTADGGKTGVSPYRHAITTDEKRTKNIVIEKWLNKADFPNGIYLELVYSDNISVKTREWKWNTAGLKKGDSAANNVTNGDDPININTQAEEDTYYNVSLSADGYRKAYFEVKDKAGNTSTINIIAPIDKTAPTTPTINMYKWTNNSTSPTSISGLKSYTNNTWSNKNIYTTASGSTDSLSGIDEYQYTTTGATTNVTNNNGTTRNIKAEGTSTIKYRACDKAGNCSNYTENTVKLDKTAPYAPTLKNIKSTKANTKIISYSCEPDSSSNTGANVCTAKVKCDGNNQLCEYEFNTSTIDIYSGVANSNGYYYKFKSDGSGATSGCEEWTTNEKCAHTTSGTNASYSTHYMCAKDAAGNINYKSYLKLIVEWS